MDSKEAKALIRSLVGRLVQQGEAYRLPEGILSGADVAALRLLGGMPARSQEILCGAKVPTFAINGAAFDSEGPTEDRVRLCLDFGTAMSKAWATGATELETMPLTLGRAAGVGDTLAVPSSIFISQTGRIFLGAAAEIQHRQEVESGRQRFDNLKRMLSEAEVGQDLNEVSLPPEIDPTQSGLSKGDLLILYLGWLTDLTLSSLSSYADSGSSPNSNTIGLTSENLRYVRRRFAIPCFEHAQDETVGGAQRAAWAKKIMVDALLRAQIVADTLSGKWAELSAQRACTLLTEVRRLDTTKLEYLLAETAPVREPVAAGASRFDDEIADIGASAKSDTAILRKILLVVDAGAGTTDFAVFQVFWDSMHDKTRYGLIAPAVRMCRVAGNEVDAALRPIVLDACGIDPKSGHPRSDEDFGLIKIDLGARIRDIKRDLFTNESAKIELRPNVSGTLALDRVLEDSEFQRLGGELRVARDTVIKSTFDKVALEAIGTWTRRAGRSYPIHVLLTGGSSTLPIVKQLATGEVDLDGATFAFLPVNELPAWISNLPREVSELVAASYPQCAVAIGGSARELPRELQDLSSPVTPPPPGPRRLERYPVTGVG